MNIQDVMKQIHQTIISGNLTTYRELFESTNSNEVTDPLLEGCNEIIYGAF
ncbi:MULTISPECIES: hypothetical protein [Bacillus cereus group]|uniref:hypothetical protein n=1 Tax=Bacillus cereus group TaxID=86661 RepID=UPI0018F34331|nr:hypothetical protein [Bacillus cereus]MBJ8007444.1 hypothetical protein [Bacillus cereus]